MRAERDGAWAPTGLQSILSRRHLPALDGLRAVAVGLVVVYHAGFAVPGDLGVTAFFVLSGFLITWLLLKEFDGTGTVSFRAFYARRTLRIFPAYYLFVFFSLGWDWLRADAWSASRVSAALLYFINYHNALTGQEAHIGHAWSLAVEEQFYLLWPAAFLAFARSGIGRLRAGLVVLTVAVLVWRSWLYLGAGVGPTYVYNAFDCRFDSLAVGCLVAAIVSHPWVRGAAESLAWGAVAPVATLAALVVSRTATPDWYHYSVGFTVDSLLVALLLVQLILLHDRGPWRWLDSEPMTFLGRISYPTYLWHILALGLAGWMTQAAWPRLAAGYVIVAGVASCSYFFVERPVLGLKGRLEASLRSRGRSRPGHAGSTAQSH